MLRLYLYKILSSTEGQHVSPDYSERFGQHESSTHTADSVTGGLAESLRKDASDARRLHDIVRPYLRYSRYRGGGGDSTPGHNQPVTTATAVTSRHYNTTP